MIELLNIDNMEYMATCKDKEFDLAIVDPPYGIGMSNYKRSILKPKFDMTKQWDDAIPADEYWKELFRVSKNQIVCGGNYFTEHLPPSKGWIFWNKKQQGNMQVGELIWTSFDRMKYWERSWQLDRNWQIEKIHPTQKPVQLYNFILKEFSEKGQRVLDTHLGSGTSAIAAHYFGVDFIGTEIDADYYNATMKRFKERTSQTLLTFCGEEKK